jgi:hypothetical protein
VWVLLHQPIVTACHVTKLARCGSCLVCTHVLHPAEVCCDGCSVSVYWRQMASVGAVLPSYLVSLASMYCQRAYAAVQASTSMMLSALWSSTALATGTTSSHTGQSRSGSTDQPCTSRYSVADWPSRAVAGSANNPAVASAGALGHSLRCVPCSTVLSGAVLLCSRAQRAAISASLLLGDCLSVLREAMPTKSICLALGTWCNCCVQLSAAARASMCHTVM